MSVITATECTIYSNISASVGTIIAKDLIPIVQEKINYMTNNYFVTDMTVTDTVIFNATARTIIANGNNFADFGFQAGDDIFIYGSHRNDGYYTIDSVVDKTITLITGSVIKAELVDQAINFFVVKWPLSIKSIAAQMCAFDYDVRPSQSKGLTSRSLGPLSESFAGSSERENGYPKVIADALADFRIARMF